MGERTTLANAPSLEERAYRIRRNARWGWRVTTTQSAVTEQPWPDLRFVPA